MSSPKPSRGELAQSINYHFLLGDLCGLERVLLGVSQVVLLKFLCSWRNILVPSSEMQQLFVRWSRHWTLWVHHERSFVLCKMQEMATETRAPFDVHAAARRSPFRFHVSAARFLSLPCAAAPRQQLRKDSARCSF